MQPGCLGTGGGQRPSSALLLQPGIHGTFALAGADLPMKRKLLEHLTKNCLYKWFYLFLCHVSFTTVTIY
jgi:hypothetical protein